MKTEAIQWEFEDCRYTVTIDGVRIPFTACQTLALINLGLPEYHAIKNAALAEMRKMELEADRRKGSRKDGIL